MSSSALLDYFILDKNKMKVTLTYTDQLICSRWFC